MANENRNFLRKSIIDYYLNKERDKVTTVHHFVDQEIKRSLIYKVIRQFEKTGTYTVKPISGRPRSIRTARNVNKVKRRIIKNPSISVRKTAIETSISKSTVQRIKQDLGAKTRRKHLAPNYKDNQLHRVKSGCKYVYELTKKYFFVMDDESYFFADSSEIPGREFYTELDGFEVESS